jgi:hypothetical protein
MPGTAMHRKMASGYEPGPPCSVERGHKSAFSWLVRLRRTRDYGERMQVSPDEAQEAVDNARSILQAV